MRVCPEEKCSNPALMFNRYHVDKRESQICKYQVLIELYNEAFTIIYLVTWYSHITYYASLKVLYCVKVLLSISETLTKIHCLRRAN